MAVKALSLFLLEINKSRQVARLGDVTWGTSATTLSCATRLAGRPITCLCMNKSARSTVRWQDGWLKSMDAATLRISWRSSGLVLLLTALCIAWLLVRPGGHSTFITGDNL